MRIRGVRGATTVKEDSKESVIEATAELLGEIFSRNGIEKDDLVSMIFTTTPDLISEFPAAAVRSLGISDIPLLCASEIPVTGAVPRCIRVLVHAYSEREHSTLRHVYLGEARQLRTDLPE